MANSIYFGIVVATIILLYAITSRYRLQPSHPSEPVFIQPKIPLVGHIIGLMQYGGAYYTELSAKYPLPIYSMPLLKSKFYVVNSLSLISSAGKISKKLSFIPFVKIAAERLSGIQPTTLEKFDSDGSNAGVAQDTIHEVEIALLGKNEATELDAAVLEHMKVLLDDLPAKTHKPLKLLEWLQHVITQASSRSVYGPMNPLQDPDTEEQFWTFEHNLGLLLLNFAPEMFKKNAIAAREKVVEKFHAYYLARGQEKGSPLARARHDAPARYGLTEEEVARLEVPFNFAVLNNTVAAAFWMLSHVFSEPKTLADLRSELEKVVRTTTASSGAKRFVIRMSDLKQKCPVLVAAFHEVLRVYSVRPNIRQVVEDTMLADRYFLEKGSIVQLATKSLHEDPAHWGPTAKQLNLRRFLESPDGGNRSKSTIAFGTFGVAPHICPGRHFAATEIMAITAQVALRYEMRPAGAAGWTIPAQNLRGFNGVTGPTREMEVQLVERSAWRGDWAYALGEEGIKFPLASG